MGNWLIFQCLESSLIPFLLLPDKASRTVVLSKYSSFEGKGRGDFRYSEVKGRRDRREH